MASSSGKRVPSALLSEDVPWRASPSGNPIPRIHQSPVLRIPSNPKSNYALAVMKHPDPIGGGFAMEAKLEAAGPDCIVPGQVTPLWLLGLKVWPIDINMKFMEPVGRELRAIGKGQTLVIVGSADGLTVREIWRKGNYSKFMDSAFNLMNASFTDR